MHVSECIALHVCGWSPNVQASVAAVEAIVSYRQTTLYNVDVNSQASMFSRCLLFPEQSTCIPCHEKRTTGCSADNVLFAANAIAHPQIKPLEVHATIQLGLLFMV